MGESSGDGVCVDVRFARRSNISSMLLEYSFVSLCKLPYSQRTMAAMLVCVISTHSQLDAWVTRSRKMCFGFACVCACARARARVCVCVSQNKTTRAEAKEEGR